MPARIAYLSLKYPGMSIRNSRFRHCLLGWGNLFHIEDALLDVTPVGIENLTAVGLDVSNIKNLAQLTDAYQTWYNAGSDAERQRLPLRIARAHIPPDASERQRLERRVLLTLARYLDLNDTLIVLTLAGETAYEEAYGELGVPAGLVRTLDRLADAPYDLAGYHISKMREAALALVPKQ